MLNEWLYRTDPQTRDDNQIVADQGQVRIEEIIRYAHVLVGPNRE